MSWKGLRLTFSLSVQPREENSVEFASTEMHEDRTPLPIEVYKSIARRRSTDETSRSSGFTPPLKT